MVSHSLTSAPNLPALVEDSAARPARPHHRMSTRNRLLFFLTAWLIVLMPFLFWWSTWFGRHLSDTQITEYLNDDKHPRHIQHALVQLGERMATATPCVASRGRSPQHRRLGDGSRHVGRGLPRSALENVTGFVADGSRQRRAVSRAFRRRRRPPSHHSPLTARFNRRSRRRPRPWLLLRPRARECGQ